MLICMVCRESRESVNDSLRSKLASYETQPRVGLLRQRMSNQHLVCPSSSKHLSSF